MEWTVVCAQRLRSSTFDEISGTNDAYLKELPEKLLHPNRLAIMKVLVTHGEAEFRDLRHDLQMTDGNLASHLRALESLGYVHWEKEILGRRIRTTYQVTQKGIRDFKETIFELKKLIDDVSYLHEK
ncbi:transcriptional regulator [Candidatus Bathyarchaeota archaeon]|nr:transcriptional regulator [Candidatus Bathyarchaeota archaeon]